VLRGRFYVQNARNAFPANDTSLDQQLAPPSHVFMFNLSLCKRTRLYVPAWPLALVLVSKHLSCQMAHR
jgi:hypothetical protein